MSSGYNHRKSMNHEVNEIKVMRSGSERNLVTMEEFEKLVDAKRAAHANVGRDPCQKSDTFGTMTFDEWDRLLECARQVDDSPARDFSSSKIESPHISNEKPGKDTHNSNLYVSVIEDLMYAFVGFMCAAMVLYFLWTNNIALGAMQLCIFMAIISRS